MKHLLLAGLALAIVVPAWSQLQPQNRPPAPPDENGRGDGPPQAGEPPVGGPIQLRHPRRGADDNGPPMDDRTGFGPGMGNFGPPQPPPATMFADERFLYILRGDTLMKFDKQTLTLLQSVELPRPIRPAQDGGPSEGSLRSRTSPPLVRRGMGANGPTF